MVYHTREIIGWGRSPSQIISRVLYAHNCLQTVLYVFYTMVNQKYAINSHLTSMLWGRNHSTIPISVYCKNSARHALSTGMLW